MVMDVLTPPESAAKPGAVNRTSRKLFVELIGTFFLVFTVGASVRSGSSLAPVAIGAVLMSMIYASGHISGGHVNPAVTLAALVVRAIVSPGQSRTLSLSGEFTAAFVAELIFTFALAYVVLNAATSNDHPGNSFYGLAIGFTVLAGAVAVGGISGGAFNPSVALGGAVMGLFAWPTLWIYLVAELVAGVAAGLAFRALNPDDK